MSPMGHFDSHSVEDLPIVIEQHSQPHGGSQSLTLQQRREGLKMMTGSKEGTRLENTDSDFFTLTEDHS
jgi:hypothetical protein